MASGKSLELRKLKSHPRWIYTTDTINRAYRRKFAGHGLIAGKKGWLEVLQEYKDASSVSKPDTLWGKIKGILGL